MLWLIAEGDTNPLARLDAEPWQCPNCGGRFLGPKSPYCSTNCREVAGWVRHFRSCLSEGQIEIPERQEALGQNLWVLLGGGRPLRRSLIPEKTVQSVLRREHMRCQVCNGAATQVEHITTGCNRPINLRAICESCSIIHPFFAPKVLQSPSAISILGELRARARGSVPLRICDDAGTWDWRDFLRVRKTVIASTK